MNPYSLAKSGLEHGTQAAFFCLVTDEINAGRLPSYCGLIHAIPNGGLRDKITAAKLKAEGAKAGVPDIFVPIAMWMYHGLYIELKRPRTEHIDAKGKKVVRRAGSTSDEQNVWIPALIAQGYGVNTCIGFEAAYDTLLAYLGIQYNWRSYYEKV